MKTATNLDPIHTPDGKFAKGNKANPDGKGGFGERREDISPGGWKKEMVFSYQYRRFMNMEAKDFIAFAEKIKSKRCTMVEQAAYMRVKDMYKSLPDIKEITDRTEGKAAQAVDVTSGGEKLEGLVIIRADDQTE